MKFTENINVLFNLTKIKENKLYICLNILRFFINFKIATFLIKLEI